MQGNELHTYTISSSSRKNQPNTDGLKFCISLFASGINYRLKLFIPDSLWSQNRFDSAPILNQKSSVSISPIIFTILSKHLHSMIFNGLGATQDCDQYLNQQFKNYSNNKLKY